MGGYTIEKAERSKGVILWISGSRVGLKFDSWDEVNEFISTLRAEAERQFGKDYSNPCYDE